MIRRWMRCAIGECFTGESSTSIRIGVRQASPYADTRLSSSISFYKSLMGIRSVKAVSASVLDIEYDIPPASNEAQQDLGRSQAKRAKQIVNSSAVLRLAFDETTKRLAMAEVGGVSY